uniref:Putative reverse transcriptase, RNA-dependent DNA polymerase, Gag-polypeptide of LTR copia-type n=1 Tax=Tanacetum cinerariifolium TaxID=118510 RepID=A0A6L2KUD2_TANCI|nr:putative reverse transcriptase, RNA-dependent DNA polymerase, Gag-polypeptide of LTR copia-type [Tanacetum cinerariifolium]
MDPIPDVKTIFFVISREESHSRSSSVVGNKHHASAFVARSYNNNETNKGPNNNNNNRKNGINPNLICSNPNCGLTGHTVDKCYKIVRYPDHIKKKWANQKSSNSFSSNNASVEVPTSIASSPCSATSLSAKQDLQQQKTLGTSSQKEVSYTPQQNGIAERKHRHLLNVTRSLLFQAAIPLNMWTKCILTATYLINRLPTSMLKGKSSYDLVFGTEPNIDHLSPYFKSSPDPLPNDESEANNQGSGGESPYDENAITFQSDNNIVDSGSTSEGNDFNIQNVVSEPTYERRFGATSKLPTKLSDFVLDEAEYRALASATCEVIWLANLLQDLNIKIEKPITMLCDNKAAIQIASNSVFHDRTKHFEIDLHFIRDKMIDGIIKPSKIESANNNADILTKGLPADQHAFLTKKLNMVDMFKT